MSRTTIQKDTAWQQTSIDKLHQTRPEIFTIATSNAIIAVLEKYANLNQKEPILELGAGDGYLSRLIPQYSDKIIQTDLGLQLLQGSHSAKRVNVRTSELPFPNESFTVIVGLDVFDVIYNLEAAMPNLTRILKKDGVIIALSDVGTNLQTLFEYYLSKDIIPFPQNMVDAQGKRDIGVILVPLADCQSYLNKSHDPALQKYLENPIKIFFEYVFDHQYNFLPLSRIAQQIPSKTKKEQTFDEFYFSRTKSAFSKAGCSIVFSGTVTGEERQNDINTYYNLYRRSRKQSEKLHDPNLQEGTRLIRSEIHVIVGKKQS